MLLLKHWYPDALPWMKCIYQLHFHSLSHFVSFCLQTRTIFFFSFLPWSWHVFIFCSRLFEFLEFYFSFTCQSVDQSAPLCHLLVRWKMLKEVEKEAAISTCSCSCFIQIILTRSSLHLSFSFSFVLFLFLSFCLLCSLTIRVKPFLHIFISLAICFVPVTLTSLLTHVHCFHLCILTFYWNTSGRMRQNRCERKKIWINACKGLTGTLEGKQKRESMDGFLSY